VRAKGGSQRVLSSRASVRRCNPKKNRLPADVGTLRVHCHVDRRSDAARSAPSYGLACRESRTGQVHERIGRSLDRAHQVVKRTGRPWPLAVEPQVRPWTRLQFRGLCSVVPDRIGFPTDMGCIGRTGDPAATFLRASRPKAIRLQSCPLRLVPGPCKHRGALEESARERLLSFKGIRQSAMRENTNREAIRCSVRAAQQSGSRIP
jgi:hypothetical protein